MGTKKKRLKKIADLLTGAIGGIILAHNMSLDKGAGKILIELIQKLNKEIEEDE